MNPWAEKIRALRQSSSVDMAICRLIELADELNVRAEQQERLVKGLEGQILVLQGACDSRQGRNCDRMELLGRRIDKLRGVHGA